jgi:hypothetical protein
MWGRSLNPPSLSPVPADPVPPTREAGTIAHFRFEKSSRNLSACSSAFTIVSACRIANSASKPRRWPHRAARRAAAITVRIAASPASIVMSCYAPISALIRCTVPVPTPAAIRY